MADRPVMASTLATRFRGFMPVVVDVETGGFNSSTDALLEVAAVILEMNADGDLQRKSTVWHHVQPFPGGRLDPASLEITGIDPHHPLQPALPERDALQRVFRGTHRIAARRLQPRDPCQPNSSRPGFSSPR
jgi:ribonuclease T